VNPLRNAALALLGAALLIPASAFAKVRVAASINDLASIAATVGGDQVEVLAIARPNNDVHRVEVLPSAMMRVARSRVYLEVGLGLDRWAAAIIDGSRNARLEVVDCSQGVPVLEKPTGKVDASMGDVHPDGNPHYWLDPHNGGIVAGTVAEALARVDPAHAADYRARAAAFAGECDRARDALREEAGRLPARSVLTYHRSWSYLANACGLEVVGTVEPKPGIPPTAKHLADLLSIVRARRVPVLIQEPYFSGDAGKFLAREGGLRVVTASASCETPAPGAYLAHLRDLIRRLGPD
jgi:zinc/manganese transport system substrate-binding protein